MKLTAVITIVFLTLCACTRVQYEPIESKHISNETDSLQRVIASLLIKLKETKETETSLSSSHTSENTIISETTNRNEKVVVDEKGNVISRNVETIIDRSKTLEKENSVLEQKNKTLELNNTVLQSQIDSLSRLHNSTDTVYKQVPYEVPAKLSKWQKFKVDYGGYALIAIILLIIGLLYKYSK